MRQMEYSVMMRNWKLRTERKRQGWTQASLAEALGVTTRTVIRWEQGLVVPFPCYRQKLSILFGKTIEELGLLSNSNTNETAEEGEQELSLVAAVPAPPPIIDPAIPQTLEKNNYLLGRAELFTQIKERVLAGECLALTALDGLPGVGRTSLTEGLANDRDVQARFRGGVLWAALGRQPHVLSQLAHWGALLGVASTDVEAPHICESWGQALQSAIGNREMLLVIDDAWTAQDAQALQIGGPHCTYLVSARLSRVAFNLDQFQSIIVPPLEEADGLVLLARYIPQLVQRDPERAYTLVQAVDSLPLTLTLIGKYLASPTFDGHPWPLRTALAQLNDIQEDLRLTMQTTDEEGWSNLAELVPLSLYSAIAMCDQQLSPRAQAALRALAIFPPKPQSFSEEAALAISQQSRAILDELWVTGLLEYWGSGRYSLHQAIADYARSRR